MSFDDLLIHTLVIYRNVAAVVPAHDPAEPTDGDPILDDYGQATYAPAVLATVDGRIRPLTAKEVPLLSQGGAVVNVLACDLYPVTGLTAACWIESGGVRHDITGILDAAGAGHHLILGLVAVT